MRQENKVSDNECVAKWREILGKFNTLIKDSPPLEKIKAELTSLKDEARHAYQLNYRQTEAIRVRCDSYLTGTYGNTKTAENMAYGNQEPSKTQSNGKMG